MYLVVYVMLMCFYCDVGDVGDVREVGRGFGCRVIGFYWMIWRVLLE